MKTRTAILIAVVGIGVFVAVQIGKRNEPARTQTPSTSSSSAQVVQYADQKAAEPTLPTDPSAKQRAIDAELNRAIKRALSDAQDDRKHGNDQ